MKRFYFIFTLLVMIYHSAPAQNRPFLNLYFKQMSFFNPAFTGSEDYVKVNANSRLQWIGFENAPATYILSAERSYKRGGNRFPHQDNSIRLSNPNLYQELERSVEYTRRNRVQHGVGVTVLRDEFGYFSNTSLQANYALHLLLGDYSMLSFGVRTVVNQESLQLNEIRLRDELNDPVYNSYLNRGNNRFTFNADAGIVFRRKSFYVSYGVNQLLTDNYISADTPGLQTERIQQVMTGVGIQLSENLRLSPSLWARYGEQSDLHIQGSLKAGYKNQFWLGAGYRTTESAFSFFNIVINQYFDLAYAYDYNFNSAIDSGAHEISLGVRLLNWKELPLYLW